MINKYKLRREDINILYFKPTSPNYSPNDLNCDVLMLELIYNIKINYKTDSIEEVKNY